MARPGGNPDIANNPGTFRTDRADPLTHQMQLRIGEAMWAQLQQQDDWREFVRDAIAEKLENSPRSPR
jgi:hypothetical protein